MARSRLSVGRLSIRLSVGRAFPPDLASVLLVSLFFVGLDPLRFRSPPWQAWTHHDPPISLSTFSTLDLPRPSFRFLCTWILQRPSPIHTRTGIWSRALYMVLIVVPSIHPNRNISELEGSSRRRLLSTLYSVFVAECKDPG